MPFLGQCWVGKRSIPGVLLKEKKHPLSSTTHRTHTGHLDGVKWKSFVGQFGIQQALLPRLFVLDFPAEARAKGGGEGFGWAMVGVDGGLGSVG